MANGFNKEEVVAFEDMCQGFEDALVLSKNVSKYETDQTTMERSNDTIWRPQPYIAQSYDGSDASANFGDNTQLSVPATIGYQKHSTATLNAKELRDMLQEGRLGMAAAQKLASDINVSVNSVAANQGTIVIKRTAAASGYDDVAEAEAAMNELGITMGDRYMALSSRDYNGMASDLAGRETMNGKPTTAYERSLINSNIAGFQLHKLDYAPRLTAALGTTVTINGANQYYTPRATSTSASGEVSNVDNRNQVLTVAVSSGTIKVGDAFTIAGVYSVHHITKESTGQLKTFRVTGIVSGAGGSGVIQISPPIISNGGGTDAEAQYQNVNSTPADGAAITWLNTVAASVNSFWHRDAIELIPGRLAIDPQSGAQVIRATLDNGVEVVLQKWFDIKVQKTLFRWDVLYGVVNKQPEMSGIMLFSQT